jgi:indolepyruvate ferredoxin oxidoreductase
LVPVSAAAIEKAIELNGVAVEQNLRTFKSGRLAAHNMEAVRKLAAGTKPPAAEPLAATLDEAIERRADFLTAYQNRAYADRYLALVNRVRAAENQVLPGNTALTDAVVRNYFKLLAYKDEYEVARLYTDGSFEQKIRAQFDGDFKMEFNLAPPLLSRTDPKTGRPAKKRFGSWMMTAFKILARLKGLRGTPLDPFGYTHERRMERALITEYEATLETLLAGLTPATHGQAVAIARLPDAIRGFGPVKAASVEATRARWRVMLAEYGKAPAQAAA